MTDEFQSPSLARLRLILADAERDLASIENSAVLTAEQVETGRAAFLDLIDAVRDALHNLESPDPR